jgi:hypothetical protein
MFAQTTDIRLRKRKVHKYTKVNTVVPKELKDKFVAKCEQKSISQSQIVLKFIHKFINDETI